MTQAVRGCRARASRLGSQAGISPASSWALVHSAIVGDLGGAVVPADRAAGRRRAATSSAVTLTNSEHALVPEGAPFPDLEVTVSQTRDLRVAGHPGELDGRQAVRAPERARRAATNFLQIAQCWGEDPANPGHPDRRTCQYGGTLGGRHRARRQHGGRSDVAERTSDVTPAERELLRADVHRHTFRRGEPRRHRRREARPRRSGVEQPHDDADGNVVQKQGAEFVDLNTNQFFTAFTTNEVKWAGPGADGSGRCRSRSRRPCSRTALGCGSPRRAARQDRLRPVVLARDDSARDGRLGIGRDQPIGALVGRLGAPPCGGARLQAARRALRDRRGGAAAGRQRARRRRDVVVAAPALPGRERIAVRAQLR